MPKKKMATDKEFDRLLGERLRALRKDRGFSMEKVGQASGVSWQQIAKYESGANRVSANILVRLSETLGVSPVDILPTR